MRLAIWLLMLAVSSSSMAQDDPAALIADAIAAHGDLESWTDAGAVAPDLDETAMTATESLSAPAHDESIVVVEQGSGIRPLDEDTRDRLRDTILERLDERQGQA